jgi:hypothetical protein
LLVALGTGVSAAELPAMHPPGIEVPPLDVEANVRRMLEEGRAREPRAEASPRPARGAVNGEASTAPGTPLSPHRALAEEPAMESDHVPMPPMTITVRSKGDVKTVAQELETATRKKAASEATTADAPQR